MYLNLPLVFIVFYEIGTSVVQTLALVKLISLHSAVMSVYFDVLSRTPV